MIFCLHQTLGYLQFLLPYREILWALSLTISWDYCRDQTKILSVRWSHTLESSPSYFIYKTLLLVCCLPTRGLELTASCRQSCFLHVDQLGASRGAGIVLHARDPLRSVFFEMNLSEVGVRTFENKFWFPVSYKSFLFVFHRDLFGVSLVESVHYTKRSDSAPLRGEIFWMTKWCLQFSIENDQLFMPRIWGPAKSYTCLPCHLAADKAEMYKAQHSGSGQSQAPHRSLIPCFRDTSMLNGGFLKQGKGAFYEPYRFPKER